MAEVKFSFEVKGLKELEEALKELPKATGRACIRRALMKAAEPMIRTARAMAPQRAIGGGRLKRSIVATKVKFSSGQAGKAAFAAAMKAGKSRQEAGEAAHEANAEAGGSDITSGILTWGPLRSAYYGMFQEFGTRNHPPKPFMRPAFDQHKVSAVTDIKEVLKEEIDKAVARIAKKQAKLLAEVQKQQ
jgi:HK97 gp10 family phage protein